MRIYIVFSDDENYLKDVCQLFRGFEGHFGIQMWFDLANQCITQVSQPITVHSGHVYKFVVIISRSFGRYLSRTISCLRFILNRFLQDAHRFILKGQFNIFLSYVYSAPSKDKSTWVMKIKFRNHEFEQMFPSLNIILLIFSIVF